ncbi:hypothetical protein, partial [Methylobacterium radiotolerans]|uniref:hypothetical protein n=1 Tax=Methylobacterium radiotolerans TaxID=31998 RepID=UPI001AEC8F98
MFLVAARHAGPDGVLYVDAESQSQVACGGGAPPALLVRMVVAHRPPFRWRLHRRRTEARRVGEEWS